MLASGTMVIGSTIGGTASVYTVTGGTIVNASAGATIQTGQTAANLPASAVHAVAIRPTAGATQMVVSLSDGTWPVVSTLRARLTVTIASASASGVYSAADSSVNMAVVSNTTVDGVDQKNTTTGSTTLIPNGIAAQINFSLKDAYGRPLAASVLSASSTAGGFVDLSSDGSFATATAGNSTVDLGTMASGAVTVTQAVANVPVTVTVTIAYRGVTVGTKTISFQGEVAKVTVTAKKIGATGSSVSNAEAANIVYTDSANNVLYPTTGTTVVAASLGDSTIVSNASVGTYPDKTPTSGKITVTCQSVAGTVPALQMRHVNSASGSVVLSNTWAQSCAGAAANLTASWDKASYTPGSIATLTLTFKDAKGFAANAYDNLDTITVTGSPSSTTASAGAAITPMNPHAARASGLTGTITQQYVVGSTTGDFVAVVVPAASLVTASGNTQANLSVPYKIASGTTSVTNEQVLASIVSLIASINKQIVALQKLILQRR